MPIAIPARRTRGPVVLVITACAAALALGACHRAPPPSNATPDAAVATSLRLTAAGDFDALMKNRLPATEYAQWRREWDHRRADASAPTTEQQQQFARITQMLTAPGAETRLAKQLQPVLANLHGGKGDAAPILGGIVEAAAREMIAQSPQLGPAQRTLAAQGLDALSAWTKTTDFSDPKKARKAIAIATATARGLHVDTLAQWRALDYATAMKDYGALWNGLQKVLKVYGLDLAASLDGATATTVTDDGNHATVNLSLTLAGKPLAGEWKMVKQDGHWYDAALLDAWRQAHAPAPGGSAAAPVSAAAGPEPATTVKPPTASSPGSVTVPQGGRSN